MSVYPELSQEQRQKLDVFARLLLKWNRAMNLSGFTTLELVWERLITDSLYLGDFLASLLARDADALTLDLGSGAGLPGIPLRIVWSQGEYIMVEARQKRAIFIENALATLELPKTKVFAGRAENFFSICKIPVDCIVSRAFMPVVKLIPFCADHIADGGFLILMTNDRLDLAADHYVNAGEYAYKSGNFTRYFTALKKTA